VIGSKKIAEENCRNITIYHLKPITPLHALDMMTACRSLWRDISQPEEEEGLNIIIY